MHSPKDQEIAVLVDGLMRRIHAGVHPKAAAIDDDRVGPVGGMVLFAIEELQPVPLLQLGRAVARDKSQITRLVHVLEAKDLIVRHAAESDARVSLISLSPNGRKLVDQLRSVVRAVVDETLSGLDAEERGTLHRLLAKALSAIKMEQRT